MDQRLGKNNPPPEQMQAKRIVWIYTTVFGLWVLMQSGVPYKLMGVARIEDNTWVETLIGGFVVISSA